MLRGMLIRMAPALALALAACNPAGLASNGNAPAANAQSAAAAVPAGWSSGRDPSGGDYLHYSWGDSSGALFSAICEGHPVILLDGGDYAAGATTFELLVDDQRWELETFENEMGRALFVDVPAIIDRIASAERRIAFRVGTWSRELRPDPRIAAFINACRSGRSGG